MSSPPSRSIQDPYGGQIRFAQNSSPGAPTDGRSSVLRMYVPAEHTSVAMGAAGRDGGPDAGIRMVTDNHAHIAVGRANTSISLGAPTRGGSGVEGLSVYTDGQKKEEVTLAVNEIYHDTKTEKISGALTVDVLEGSAAKYTYSGTLDIESQARTEKVHGNWTATIDETLGVECRVRDEKVHGNWTAVVDGGGGISFKADKDIEFTATGKVKNTSMADSSWLVAGDSKWFQVGKFNKIVVGLHSDTRLAAHMDTRIGAHIDTKIAVNIETRVGPQLRLFSAVNMKNPIEVKLSELFMESGKAVIWKSALKLLQASMYVLK